MFDLAVKVLRPPFPQLLPRLHKLLDRFGRRQPLTFHPAFLPGCAVQVSHALIAELRKILAELVDFVLRKRRVVHERQDIIFAMCSPGQRRVLTGLVFKRKTAIAAIVLPAVPFHRHAPR